MKMYEILKEMEAVESRMLEDGQVGEETIKDLEMLDLALARKAEEIGKVLLNFKAQKNMIEGEILRLHRKVETLENLEKGLKLYVKNQMEWNGLPKIKTPVITLSVQKGREKAEIWDEALIPLEYIREVTTTKIDSRGILKALKEDKNVAGAKIVRGQSFLTMR